MPETNTEPSAEAITKKEQQFSPSQSDSEREDAPRDRHTVAPDERGEYDSVLSTKWPYPVEVADKLEKIKLL